MITLRDITIGYTINKPLLKGFNKEFGNKIYGILGESGCGKTTLLRTIAGLTKPLSGKVLIDGTAIKKANQNNIYMLHQNYTSFDWLCCLDNVLIAKEIKGKVSTSDILKAKEMLKSVGLIEYQKKYPTQLSGGQRQRLALARTLFMKPQILLMDEPLSALDPDTRSNMQDMILQLHKETQNTILIVTHDLKEADKMCDEIIKF